MAEFASSPPIFETDLPGPAAHGLIQPHVQDSAHSSTLMSSQEVISEGEGDLRLRRPSQDDPSGARVGIVDILEGLNTFQETEESQLPELALQQFTLLWRGIAALITFDEFQTDPDTSWKMVDEQLQILQPIGIDMVVPIQRLRAGELNISVVVAGTAPGSTMMVAEAVAEFILSTISLTENTAPDLAGTSLHGIKISKLDQIDSMMLLGNLLSNRWQRVQADARRKYYEAFHKQFQNPASSRGIEGSSPILETAGSHRYFTPL